jgi:hypothetical protein
MINMASPTADVIGLLLRRRGGVWTSMITVSFTPWVHRAPLTSRHDLAVVSDALLASRSGVVCLRTHRVCHTFAVGAAHWSRCTRALSTGSDACDTCYTFSRYPSRTVACGRRPHRARPLRVQWVGPRCRSGLLVLPDGSPLVRPPGCFLGGSHSLVTPAPAARNAWGCGRCRLPFTLFGSGWPFLTSGSFATCVHGRRRVKGC